MSEDELRRAVRLEAAGGYDFSYLRFVREPREDDDRGAAHRPLAPGGGDLRGLAAVGRGRARARPVLRQRPLPGRMPRPAGQAAHGGGAARPGAAVEAVLRDNLFGLEIDPRCTQIAAFNLALAAWTWPGARGHRPLPALNLACSGLASNATRDDWTAMADPAADASGLPAKREPPLPGESNGVPRIP